MIDERTAGRVLVVDADEGSRRRLELRLIEAGFVVITCDSSARCLEIVESAAPEVVLLDLDLPGVGALGTCRHLKSRRDTSDIPVIFMTEGDRSESRAVEVLEAGGTDFVRKFGSKALLGARLDARVAAYRAQVRLRQVSMTDELTGLASRRFLMDSLRREVSGSARRQEGISLLVVDIDHFRKFNDKYGHKEGDRILQMVADRVHESVRDSDLVGRTGSDEFVVLLSATTPEGAKSAAEKIRARVESELPQTVSIGVSTMPPPAVDELTESRAVDVQVERLLGDAHAALGDAKRDGRNRVAVHAS